MREKDILPLVSEKLGVSDLNEMQRRMLSLSPLKRDIILLSPTGSGKTLAFALPMLKFLNPPAGRVQAVVIAPSRELVCQIASVISSIAPGYLTVALYGGHKVEDELNSLNAGPDIVVATPGRLLDHSRRRNVELITARIVALDEFDKSLELGFEEDMRKLIGRMKNVSRYILTSATRAASLPDFLKLADPLEVDFLGDASGVRRRMSVRTVKSDSADKLESLLTLLCRLAAGKDEVPRTIVFVNHRESAGRVYEFLRRKGVDVALYHGALDQRDREIALARFNSGSSPVLVATDLAARGLDIRGVENIVHYHQPLTEETYTHRNGRTARVDASGSIYLLLGPDEQLKPYVLSDGETQLDLSAIAPLRSGLSTLRFSAGKREKLSRGDILGFLVKECGLNPHDVGKISVFDHYSLAAVATPQAPRVVGEAESRKIKGVKRKVMILQ